MIGDELFAWQVQEPDGRWSMVAAGIDSDAQMPLIHRSLEIMERLRPFAELHAKMTDQPLRLAKFELATVLEGLGE